MLFYFTAIAVLGVIHIVDRPPVILAMLNPLNAVHFFIDEPSRAFLAMGSVVLAVTGAEALYADMGHFGRRPIKVSLALLRPSGAAAQLHGAGRDAAVDGPAHGAVRSRIRSSILRSESLAAAAGPPRDAATIIASQAVISGAFSVTQQAIQLGFVPRLRIAHTSESAAGQIYIPLVNWALMIMVILLVADLPQFVQPRGGLRHRGHRRDADRHGADRGGADRRCGTGTAISSARCWRSSSRSISAIFGSNLHQDPRRRLVPAAGRRDRLHLPDDLGEGPAADDRADERGEPADGDLHQVGRDRAPRASPAPRCS